MRRAERLFLIVQHLRARRLTTAARLSEFLHVSERTVYRDIRDLSLSGVPILGEAGVGYSLDRSFELTPLMFTPEEVEAVVVGLRMAQAFGGSRIADAVGPALDKVILALPKERRAEVKNSQIYAPRINSNSAIDALKVELNAAIMARAVLRFAYKDGEGKSSRRTVRPLALYFWGSVWTLAAWCEMRNDFRSFRIDRIGKCAPTGSVFRDEPGRNLADFLERIGVPKGRFLAE